MPKKYIETKAPIQIDKDENGSKVRNPYQKMDARATRLKNDLKKADLKNDRKKKIKSEDCLKKIYKDKNNLIKYEWGKWKRRIQARKLGIQPYVQSFPEIGLTFGLCKKAWSFYNSKIRISPLFCNVDNFEKKEKNSRENILVKDCYQLPTHENYFVKCKRCGKEMSFWEIGRHNLTGYFHPKCF